MPSSVPLFGSMVSMSIFLSMSLDFPCTALCFDIPMPLQGPPYKHPSFDAPRCLPCHFDYPRNKLKLFTGATLLQMSCAPDFRGLHNSTC